MAVKHDFAVRLANYVLANVCPVRHGRARGAKASHHSLRVLSDDCTRLQGPGLSISRFSVSTSICPARSLSPFHVICTIIGWHVCLRGTELVPDLITHATTRTIICAAACFKTHSFALLTLHARDMIRITRILSYFDFVTSLSVQRFQMMKLSGRKD